jgi:7,8-dihydropterin-6-yl-methyl-4-(beta-D-ribofuranosyl)aminobenzene 5'-phosphate synthase
MERVGPQLNDQPPCRDLLAEFGLSLHVESRRGPEARNILVDFGITPEVLLNNLAILKVDPANLDALVLNHGHYVHFGGLVGFQAAAKGRLKVNTPFFVSGEDCFCTREFGRGGNMGAVDRNALRDAGLSLMVSEGPSIVGDHGFTSGPIALSSFEKPLVPSKMKAGVVDGFGCFPDRLPPERNSNTFIPDDFQHEIATNFLVRDKGLPPWRCQHRETGASRLGCSKSPRDHRRDAPSPASHRRLRSGGCSQSKGYQSGLYHSSALHRRNLL